MRPGLFSREHTRTAHVELNRKKCKACWQCLENCPNQVIGKIDLPWHKHALIVDSRHCSGCLKCVKTCRYGAYTKSDRAAQQTAGQKTRLFRIFIINNLLLFSGLATVLSGLVLQLGFHIGGQDRHHTSGYHIQPQTMDYERIRNLDTDKTIWHLNYYDWSTVHKVSIVLFSLFMAYHIYTHWKFYKILIYKRLIGNNIQVITLSGLFLLVAATGLIPWFIDLSGATSDLRLFLIEIHDKIALILIFCFILHLIKRNKWFAITYAKLKKQE